tara:strand:+ start:213 stop:365 length:153 start_codon:yes stop_codon:yes gene_type:complete
MSVVGSNHSEQFLCKNEKTVLKAFAHQVSSNHLNTEGSMILDLVVGDYVY